MSNVNIKNTSGYTGNVEVIAYKDGIEYAKATNHNKGTAELCAYIAECLRGTNIIANRPGYLIPLTYTDAYDKIGTPLFNYGIMYNAMSDVTMVADSSGNDYATYTLTFLIPSTVLIGVSELQGLRLLGLNKVTYANVRLSNPITVLPNTNIKVNWTLKVSSVSAAQEEV